ncbi:MAG: DUF1223 domain-containing protein [Gammaproteobacteria bacterium]|nr:DUF1223 domain-containing protein [Gammaproteobacteria bacterium]
MKKIIMACLLCSLTYPVVAQHFESTSQQTVVELFTSEGCSSCPPADHWLSSLVSHPQLFKTLFPMAFHVDYWNQLGWHDRFSSSRHSQRQRVYKQQGAISQVYTPGVLVNGDEWRGWIGKQTLPLEFLDNGHLSVDINNRRLHARYSGLLPQKRVLNIAYLGMGLSSNIEAGENSGRQLRHEFVVLDYKNQLGSDEWTMVLPAIPKSGQKQTAVVIWLSTLSQLKPAHITGGILNISN